MKRVLLLFIVLTYAFHSSGQVSMGLRSGYTAASLEVTGETGGGSGETAGGYTTFHGWHLDLVINVPVYEGLYFQPVIRYITKGTGFGRPQPIKPELSGAYVPAGSKLQLNYLELPLNVVYKFPLGNGKVTAGLGPYVAAGLKGRYHFNIMQNGRNITNNSKQVQFSRKANDNLAVVRMYPWDAGANFALGYEFNNGIMLGANYSMGMTDADRSEYTTSRNRYLAVSVGFLFNREDY